jgi:hypothetical protein
MNIKNKTNCIKTSSNCIVWDGPNIPCLKLCKGDTVTDVFYKLAMDHCEVLKTLDPSQYDISCFNDTSCPPETFKDLFQKVINKICAIEKIPGPAGEPGQPGANGKDGDKIEITTLAIGSAECPCGGIKVKVLSGLDGSTKNQSTICNGCAGAPGEPGEEGPEGPQGLAIIGPPGNPGSNGSNGKSGRGIAVFAQSTEPINDDFDVLYGSVEGFGVNGITGSNVIKPGDIWIEPCNP